MTSHNQPNVETTPEVIPIFQETYERYATMNFTNKGMNGMNDLFQLIETIENDNAIKFLRTQTNRKNIVAIHQKAGILNLNFDTKGFYSHLHVPMGSYDVMDVVKDKRGNQLERELYSEYQNNNINAEKLKIGILNYICYAPIKDAFSFTEALPQIVSKK